MEVEAPAERAYGDHADRNQPDDNNETMVVQEHADAAEDLYRDISIPKAEDETNGNPANPAISNGKRSTCACCCFPSKATPGSRFVCAECRDLLSEYLDAGAAVHITDTT